jgi:drug/metabolite transporter (DMT)-like permease
MGRSPDAGFGRATHTRRVSTPAAEVLDAPTEAPLDRLALGAFAASVAIGGSNFVAIRFSNRELDPLWGAGLRFALAAVVFGLLFAGLRLALPRGRDLALVAVYGLLSVGAAYGCLYWALRDVPAGIAAVVLAVGPLLTLLLAVAQGMERLSGRALAGAVVALAGSAVIFAEPGGKGFGWGSFALLGLAALCASEAVVVSKRVSAAQHPVTINFVGITAGAAVLLLVAWAGGDRLALPREGETQLALAYLVMATVAIFLLVLFVVQRWTASAASYLFVLMPVVAVGMGALLLDEAVTAATVVGGAIVCGGVYVGAARRR